MPLQSQLKTSVAGPSAPESRERNAVAPAKTLSIPEAGDLYFGLSKNGSYDAASRGEIPFIVVGRLKRVSVAKMEQIMADGVGVPAPPPPIETSEPVKGRQRGNIRARPPCGAATVSSNLSMIPFRPRGRNRPANAVRQQKGPAFGRRPAPERRMYRP